MKICPRCGSNDIDWIIPQNWSVWICKYCDYTGPIIEGNRELSEEIRRDYLKSRRENVDKKKDEEFENDDLIDEKLEKS